MSRAGERRHFTMRGRNQQARGWDEDEYAGVRGQYDDEEYAEYAGEAEDGDEAGWYADDEERGLVLDSEHSLVGVSNTVTHHGVPLLSYTRTMNRFYTSRKQRLSLGRFKCEVCGDRIRFWAWETGNGTRTHDGCYERLAWTWTNLYAQQQHLAAQGNLE
jgi:hypothetical protein